jgi:hypothetical protein
MCSCGEKTVFRIRTWIMICIDFALLDPELTNKPDFQPFKKAFEPTYRYLGMFYDILPT